MTPQRLREIAHRIGYESYRSEIGAYQVELRQLADELEARDKFRDSVAELVAPDRDGLVSDEHLIARIRDGLEAVNITVAQEKRIMELQAALDRLVGFVERSHVAFSDTLLKAEAMGECAAAAAVYHKGQE